MCFSAPASFTVSSILGLAGVLTVNRVRMSPLLLLALIPLFFGVQQFCEGIVWLQIGGMLEASQFTELVKRLYLFFAWAFWPSFIPLAVLLVEEVTWKKVVFGVCLLIGAYVTYCDVVFIWNQEISSVVRGSSLYYGKTSAWDQACYGVLIFVPLLLSSFRNLWVFGVLVLLSFLVSQWIYSATFTSVWCFFSAAASFVLYLILQDESEYLPHKG